MTITEVALNMTIIIDNITIGAVTVISDTDYNNKCR